MGDRGNEVYPDAMGGDTRATSRTTEKEQPDHYISADDWRRDGRVRAIDLLRRGLIDRIQGGTLRRGQKEEVRSIWR
jgi:hypothetical protein